MPLPFQVVSPAHLRPVAEVAARAFATDPLFVYLLPDDALRMQLLSEIMHALMAPLTPLGGTYSHGEERNLGGVLCIERSNERAAGLDYVRSFSKAAFAMIVPLAKKGLRLEELRRLKNGLQVLTQIQSQHPEEPHGYVAVLAVEPSAQKQGIGRVLLSSFIAECDQRHEAVHLETSREENVGYYERFGFRLVRTLTVSDTPPVWIMTRPRSA